MVGTTVPMLAPMVEAEHYCARFGTRLTVRYPERPRQGCNSTVVRCPCGWYVRVA